MTNRLFALFLLAGCLRLTLPLSAQPPASQRPAAPLRDDPKMKPFLDQLMQQMTLAEKIGQLNLAATGFDVTGPVVSKDVRGSIARGNMGALLNHKNTGRPATGGADDKYKSSYSDVVNEPLYPFGYGLSYNTFEYGKPELSTSRMSPDQPLDVRVTVRNTGNYDGEEVAQLYLRDLMGSVSRPVKELKSFQKVPLKKGESRTLTFRLTVEDLRFYNDDLRFVAEPGEFQVFVGGNSRDVQRASFALE